MSTKKFGIVAGIAIALSVVVSPVSAACSLTDMSGCDNTGLMSLIAQLLGGQSTTSTTTTTGTSISGIPAGFTFATNLKQGSTGNDVKYLQVLLNSNSATSIGNAGSETTYFGAMTKAAVVKFQNLYKSEVLTPYGLAAGTGFFGTSTRAKANALIAGGTTTTTTTGTGTTTTTTPTTGAYTVALAANQPSGTLGSTSAYNKVLNINVSAGATAQSITSVTLQRTGLSVDSNVGGVLVVDANGNRHGNIVTFGNNVATVSFTSDPITVAAGTTSTISIQLNMDTSATAGTLGINLTGMSGTPTGLPLVGNTFNLVSAANTLGQVSTDVNVLNSSASNQNIGTTGFIISKLQIAEGGVEDVYLKKLTLFQNGSAADTDIQNIKLVALDGTTLATVATATNKYVTFDLSANPYKIGKGVTKYFNIVVDVVSGSTRTAQFVLQNNYDVVLTGASSGLSILPTGTFPMGTTANQNTISIGSGQITISKDSTTPSGTVGIAASNTTVATFAFKASGEDIELRQAKLYLTGIDNSNKLSGTIKLVTEDGQTIYTGNPSIFYPSSSWTSPAQVTFSTYYVIPAGTTKKISLVVDTSTNITAADTLQGGIASIYYRKVSTNSYDTALVAAGTTDPAPIYGNTLNISRAALAIVSNGSFGSGSVVAGSSNVKIGSYLLQTNSIDAINVSGINIQVGSTATSAPALSNLTLKRSDTGSILGNAVSNPSVGAISGSAVGWGTNNTFSVSGQLNITANSTVQVDVYADVPTTAAVYVLQTRIFENGVSATGVNSGVDASGPYLVNSGSYVAAQTPQVTTGGTLAVGIETSGAASSQFLTTGLSGVELGKVKLAATVEDMKLDRLEVKVLNGAGNISSVKLLGTGQSTDPVAYLTGNTAIFTFNSGSEIVVPAYSSRVLTVAADTTNVGTLKGGQFITAGFGTANAKGSGSGNIVEETAGTAQTAGTADSAEVADFTQGDIVYFTVTAASGNTTPGYYMMTGATTADDLDLVGTGLTLNGTVTKFSTGTKVSNLAGSALNTASAIVAAGDIVYVYGATASGTTSVVNQFNGNGFYIVNTAITGSIAGADAIIPGLTVGTGRVTKLTNTAALVGNTMQVVEVKPVLSKNTTSPSGTLSPQADQVVAVYDVKAQGSRDLTLNTLLVQPTGSNTPARFVNTWKLYNGSTLIDTVANNITGVVTGEGPYTATFTIPSSVKTNDVMTVVETKADASLVITSHTVTSGEKTANAFTATVAAAASAAVAYDNSIHFATAQTITAGQTMTLTVKADTSSVRSGLTSGQTANLTISIPGTAGPITTVTGGVNWTYSHLGSSSIDYTGTGDDEYPLNSNTLSY